MRPDCAGLWPVFGQFQLGPRARLRPSLSEAAFYAMSRVRRVLQGEFCEVPGMRRDPERKPSGILTAGSVRKNSYGGGDGTP